LSGGPEALLLHQHNFRYTAAERREQSSLALLQVKFEQEGISPAWELKTKGTEF